MKKKKYAFSVVSVSCFVFKALPRVSVGSFSLSGHLRRSAPPTPSRVAGVLHASRRRMRCNRYRRDRTAYRTDRDHGIKHTRKKEQQPMKKKTKKKKKKNRINKTNDLPDALYDVMSRVAVIIYVTLCRVPRSCRTRRRVLGNGRVRSMTVAYYREITRGVATTCGAVLGDT